jgi:hypothetical protein
MLHGMQHANNSRKSNLSTSFFISVWKKEQNTKELLKNTKENSLDKFVKLSPQHLGGRGRRISEFKASLVYKVSSRTARAIQRNPVSKKEKKKKQASRMEIAQG